MSTFLTSSSSSLCRDETSGGEWILSNQQQLPLVQISGPKDWLHVSSRTHTRALRRHLDGEWAKILLMNLQSNNRVAHHAMNTNICPALRRATLDWKRRWSRSPPAVAFSKAPRHTRTALARTLLRVRGFFIFKRARSPVLFFSVKGVWKDPLSQSIKHEEAKGSVEAEAEADADADCCMDKNLLSNQVRRSRRRRYKKVSCNFRRPIKLVENRKFLANFVCCR